MAIVKSVGDSAHPVTDQAAATAHGAIDVAATHVASAEARARELAATSAEKLESTQQRAKQRVDSTVGKVDGFMRKNAIATTAGAFVLGALATLLLRRRSPTSQPSRSDS